MLDKAIMFGDFSIVMTTEVIKVSADSFQLFHVNNMTEGDKKSEYTQGAL